MGSIGRINNRLETVFDYVTPYDNTKLSLSTHDTEIRRTGGKQIPGNSRGQPCSQQSIIEIHGQYLKDVIENREALRNANAAKYEKYILARKEFFRDIQGTTTEDTNDLDTLNNPNAGIIAPLHSPEVFNCKIGNILFLAVPWGCRFPAEVKMPGASNVVVEDCFNLLTKFCRLIFWGIAEGESCAFANDGREDFATHVFGTMTPCPNYGPLTLPIGASLYMSGSGYTFDTPAGKVPVFAPHGQHAKKVMPFPFYLKDTNIWSIQERVRFFVFDSIIAREKEFSDGNGGIIDVNEVQKAVFQDLLGFIVEQHLTPQIRTEIMIDDLVRLIGLEHILRRAAVWFANGNNPLETEVTLQMCRTAYRIAQGFLVNQERVATHYMKAVFKKDVRIEHEMKEKRYDQVFPDNMSRQDLMAKKYWLETMIESYRNVAQSCFSAILKDRWMGTNANRTCPPNTSYDLLIRIGHPDVC